MELHKSKYQEVLYLAPESTVSKSWTPLSEDMSEEEFLSEIRILATKVEEVKPFAILDDTTHFAFPITPELQTWVGEEIFPRFIAAGVRRYALIVSSEFIAQLSIEQTMEEAGSNFQTAYFDSAEKAAAWIQSAAAERG
jgi:hypothetical protein